MTAKGSSCARLSSWAIAASTAVAVLAGAHVAHAEDVSATGKGITGGALLGAEVVMLGEAAFKVKPAWAYIIGGVVGAGGGGFAGHLVEQNGSSEACMYMLAGGMALVIPTTVAVLQAASYSPPEGYVEDRPTPGTPVAEPPRPSSSPGTTAPASDGVTPPATPATAPPSPLPPASPGGTSHYRAPSRLPYPVGLVEWGDSGMKLAVPAVEVRQVYTQLEIAKYGLSQQHELRIPVFHATF